MTKKKFKIFLTVIIVGALIARLVYVIKVPYNERQHDLGENSSGALNYIKVIYETGHLPNSNNKQYYHPPLHHILSAGWLKMINIIFPNSEKNFQYESLQFLTVIYSMLIVVCAYKIFKELRLSKKVKLLLMLIIAFHPSLIILSGSLNNDELCFLLELYALLRLMKWYKKDSILNTISLAIVTGLCVMTKISGALIALPIIYVFLFKLYKEMKKSKEKKEVLKKHLSRFILFGLISLPIGLWFGTRNFILFGQKLLYVPNPGDSLFVGDYRKIQRFLPFSNEIFSLYCKPFDDYNIPIYLLKCSLFGEYNWGEGLVRTILYFISLGVNAIFVIYTAFCVIKNMITKNKRNVVWRVMLFIVFVSNIISYISMNIKMPYGCTMDFRYLFPALFSAITFIGIELNNKKKYNNIVYTILIILQVILLISSNGIIFSWNK